MPPGRFRKVTAYLEMPRIPGAIAELDGVRAIAILLVLARHSTRVFEAKEQTFFVLGGWQASSFLINGWVGVDLFFVLSGFLITHHVLKRFSTGFPLRAKAIYLVKRLLRIVPAYYATLLAVVFGAFWFYEFPQDDLPWRTIYHLLFLQDYLGSDIVVAFWSLGVEEKFYLLAPFLLLPLARWSTKARLGTMGVLFITPMVARAWGFSTIGAANYGTFFESLRSPFHMSFDGLVAGCLLAYVYRDRDLMQALSQRRFGIRALQVGAAMLALLLLPAPLLDRVSATEAALLGTLVSLAFALTTFGILAGETSINRWLRSRWLLFFSRISYSLYLVHMIFMEATWHWLAARFEPYLAFGELPAEVQFTIYLPTYLVFSIATALLLHYAVEKPFLLLKDRI